MLDSGLLDLMKFISGHLLHCLFCGADLDVVGAYVDDEV